MVVLLTHYMTQTMPYTGEGYLFDQHQWRFTCGLHLDMIRR